MPLRLKSASGKLTKTRIKREGGEKGKITAMTLTFQAVINKSNLKALLNTNDAPVLHEDAGRKAPLYPYMGDIKTSVEYSGGKLEFMGQALTDCTFRNWTFCAQEGNTLGVQFDVKCHPTKNQISTFESDLLGEIGQLSADDNILIDPSPESEEDEEEDEDDLFEQAEKL